MQNQNQNLYFNILTFDFPQKEQTFYFSKEDIEFCKPIHKSLFPREIETIFPGVTTDGTDFIYSTFDYAKEGFTSLSIDLNWKIRTCFVNFIIGKSTIILRK